MEMGLDGNVLGVAATDLSRGVQIPHSSSVTKVILPDQIALTWGLGLGLGPGLGMGYRLAAGRGLGSGVASIPGIGLMDRFCLPWGAVVVSHAVGVMVMHVQVLLTVGRCCRGACSEP